MKKTLGWLWASPWTVTWLVVALVGGATPHAVRPGGLVWLVGKRGFWAWWFRSTQFTAITVGTCTISCGDVADNPTVIAHESCHARQAMRWGPLFIPAYLCGWALAGFDYRANTFEVEAYAAQDT
jgi:hypothetical protein